MADKKLEALDAFWDAVSPRYEVRLLQGQTYGVWDRKIGVWQITKLASVEDAEAWIAAKIEADKVAEPSRLQIRMPLRD